MNLFISSPQSKSGKTFVAAGLSAIMQALGYKSSFYKPIQLGAEENFGFLISPDVAFVKNIDPYIECQCSYIFRTLAAPAIAAELENTKIDVKTILKDYKKINHKADCTIVEGLDGLMLPISQDCMFSDIIKLLDLSILFVVDAQMSNIDSILSSINQAHSGGLKISGIVLNKFPFYNNDLKIKSLPRLIEEYSDAKVLGIIKQFSPNEVITPPVLISTLLNSLDIEKIFNIPLPKLNPGSDF